MPNIHSPTAAGALTPAVAVGSTSPAHHDGATVLSAGEVTQGIKLGHMRYVLGIGLALAAGAGVVLAVFFTH
jgi:hypothetical protein